MFDLLSRITNHGWTYINIVLVWLQHAVGYVNSEKYYGARASVNVWSPRIGDPSEFSLSQIWVLSGSFGNDLNTIEAGWQVHA
jgi:hypothetical protein